jgi:hypothetical protein
MPGEEPPQATAPETLAPEVSRDLYGIIVIVVAFWRCDFDLEPVEVKLAPVVLLRPG